MNTTQSIRQAIADMTHGAVFSSADFLSTGTRAAVDQALHRMMRSGEIARVARGLYASAGQSVDAQTVAQAVAHKTGERVGLVPSAGTHDVLVVPTSGQSRTVKAVGGTLQFRRMSQRKVQLAASPKGRALLELWGRGQANLTTTEIKRATGDWSIQDINSFAAMIPAWLRTAIEQTNAPRKSTKIGLSGAYDWSNPHIKDDVLIGKVLEKHKFEDVARLCFYYGAPKVKRVFNQREFEPITSASVKRMLANISKGLKASQGHAHAHLKSAPKVSVSKGGFDVLGVAGLLVMKSIVVYDRVKSRDIYDLMVLTRDHGYTLDDVFAAIDAYQPIRNKDPEHFKCVVTSVIPLDKDDEGFASIRLRVKMDDIYKCFKKLINDYEVRAVNELRSRH